MRCLSLTLWSPSESVDATIFYSLNFNFDAYGFVLVGKNIHKIKINNNNNNNVWLCLL